MDALQSLWSTVTGRGRRRIGSKRARAMATWSHFRFQRLLLNRAREYPWCRVQGVQVRPLRVCVRPRSQRGEEHSGERGVCDGLRASSGTCVR
ncbi:hypothetical protein V1524DRAFT_440511 [Lipomyces starkeyi]